MDESDAKHLICHVSVGKEVIGYCLGSACMAWRSRPDRTGWCGLVMMDDPKMYEDDRVMM